MNNKRFFSTLSLRKFKDFGKSMPGTREEDQIYMYFDIIGNISDHLPYPRLQILYTL